MKYQSLEQIALEADVHPGMGMSRRERLERWVELLERQAHRRLSTIEGTEFGSRREREAKRADHSPLTVAFEDPMLRAAGLRGDRVGDAVGFFDLSHGEVHRAGGVRVLCDFLVALGLLDWTDKRYVAAPDAAAYLDRRSPTFIGDALDFAASDTILKAVLSDPVAVVRNGGTILGQADHFVAPDQADWATYARAVAPMMARSAALLAELITSRRGENRRILDIASGPGQNGIALARRLPDARVTAIDWPSVLEVAAENARAAGLAERWDARPGSALETEFAGPYDVALVARFLHLLAPQQREALLRRVRAALAPGGRVVALQIMLNDDRVSPPFAAAMNFNVLATTPPGQVPTAGELEAVFRTVGFDRLERHDLPDSDERVVVAWE